MFLFAYVAPFLVLFAGRLYYDSVDASSPPYDVVNRVARFGKEITAKYTLDDFYIVTTIPERKLYRCAKHCWKRSRCYFVNYARRFQLCILFGIKWNNLNWEASVVEKPGSVMLVKKDLIVYDWKNKDKYEDCGPHEEPQSGDLLGNMFSPGSKTIHTCETKPDKFVTYKCVSGVWSVVPVGDLTEPCCEQWQLKRSCYSYDPDVVKTMHAADEQCRASGGYLIHIETMEEQNFISDMMEYINKANETMVLIGLTDEETEGIFKLLGEATEISFRHFAPREPGGKQRENCVILWPLDDYRWHDIPCSVQCPYICEYEL